MKKSAKPFAWLMIVLACASGPAQAEDPRQLVQMYLDRIEAAARRARYAALERWLPADACLLTAHNRDDQAETLLLQLLRGAGPDGLAAMAPLRRFGRGWHGRPLLDVGRSDLLAWSEAEGLGWVEDPSNADTALDRNFLRHRVLPVVRERWPGAAAAVARSAAHQQAALALLRDLGALDLDHCRGRRPHCLSVSRLAGLPAPRQRNLVRHWLARQDLPTPPSRVLEQLLEQMLCGRADAEPRVTWPGAEVRRYRGELFAMRPLPAPPSGLCLAWDGTAPLEIPGAGGVLNAITMRGAGVARRLLYSAPVTVRFREGGERLRPAGRPHRRLLKHLFQEAGIPPWERDRVPLIHAGGRLVAVAGLWVADEAAAGAEEAGIRFDWSRLHERRAPIA
jgi:tRNA(Ile)-lysidine synthase